jgi:hypothetical protein
VEDSKIDKIYKNMGTARIDITRDVEERVEDDGGVDDGAGLGVGSMNSASRYTSISNSSPTQSSPLADLVYPQPYHTTFIIIVYIVNTAYVLALNAVAPLQPGNPTHRQHTSPPTDVGFPSNLPHCSLPPPPAGPSQHK